MASVLVLALRPDLPRTLGSGVIWFEEGEATRRSGAVAHLQAANRKPWGECHPQVFPVVAEVGRHFLIIRDKLTGLD